jgi:hypothetical protein
MVLRCAAGSYHGLRRFPSTRREFPAFRGRQTGDQGPLNQAFRHRGSVIFVDAVRPVELDLLSVLIPEERAAPFHRVAQPWDPFLAPPIPPQFDRVSMASVLSDLLVGALRAKMLHQKGCVLIDPRDQAAHHTFLGPCRRHGATCQRALGESSIYQSQQSPLGDWNDRSPQSAKNRTLSDRITPISGSALCIAPLTRWLSADLRGGSCGISVSVTIGDHVGNRSRCLRTWC